MIILVAVRGEVLTVVAQNKQKQSQKRVYAKPVIMFRNVLVQTIALKM